MASGRQKLDRKKEVTYQYVANRKGCTRDNHSAPFTHQAASGRWIELLNGVKKSGWGGDTLGGAAYGGVVGRGGGGVSRSVCGT